MRRNSTSKGVATRDHILDAAIALAREVGVAGLTIGELAERVGMSKSGLFSHFGAKEALQLAVLQAAQQRFDQQVAKVAFQAPRGLARLRTLFAGWLQWGAAYQTQGGCLMLAAASEFDDRPGPVRDLLASMQQGWLSGLARTVAQAVEAGELPPDTDGAQFAFELFGLVLGAHHHVRLLQEPRFLQAASLGLERLIAYPPRRFTAIPAAHP